MSQGPQVRCGPRGGLSARLLCGVLGLTALGSGYLSAQPAAPACDVRGSREWLSSRASPLDSAVLVIGQQVAKLCYSRPSARGRTVVPTLVEYGKAWRTGANEPTTLHLTSAAEVAGVRLKAGRYVILTVPGPAQWRIQFNTTAAADPAEAFRSLVPIGLGVAQADSLSAPVEQFTIRSVSDSGGAAAFVLEWGYFRVRVPVSLAP